MKEKFEKNEKFKQKKQGPFEKSTNLPNLRFPIDDSAYGG